MPLLRIPLETSTTAFFEHLTVRDKEMSKAACF